MVLFVDSLFIVAPIGCWGSGFSPCFVLDGEGGASCFTLIVFLMSCDSKYSMALPHGNKHH